MKYSTFTILICFSAIKLFTFSLGTDVSPNDTEYLSIKKLRKKLLNNFDIFTHPVQEHSNTTAVNFTFVMAYSFGYEERTETFKIEGFYRMAWFDHRLVWNPSEYGGIAFLSVDPKEIWLPDIGIYESVPAQFMTEKQYTKPMLISTGEVRWAPRSVFFTHCPFNVNGYPEDVQSCNMTFGSWADGGVSVDLQVKSRKVYKGSGTKNDNSEWILLGFDVNRVVNYKAGSPFVNIVVTTKFRRASPTVHTVAGPATVVATILMLSMFWLPPSSEKKLTLGGSALFMLLGLLLYVAASTRSPLIIGAAVSPIRSVIFITIAALLSEIVVVIVSKFMMTPPPVLKNVVDGSLGKILFLNSPTGSNYNEELQALEKKDTEETWYKTAMATDRIFFVLFAVVVVLNKII